MDIAINCNSKIPLRDGVQLNAIVYLPRQQNCPLPCVLAVTPYISDTYHARGLYFAQQGLPSIVVDSRGRGGSGGVFHPNDSHGLDGYDVVEWVAKQSYCDGKVGMWGGSYFGFTQWATIKECPPHLATIVPAAAPYFGVDFPMRNNIFFPYLLRWLTLITGPAAQWKIFSDDSFWSGVYRRWYHSGRSFRELDSEFGSKSAVFQEWLTHPRLDDYWDSCNPTREEYARLQIPILTITGTYDDDQAGALEHYKRHLLSCPEAPSNSHYLVIGPWDHQGTGNPVAEFGGLRIGPEGVVDLAKLHLDWYRWTMQGGPRPSFLRGRVMYYVMGAERWKCSDSLEGITVRHQQYFLDSITNADDVFHSGSLGESPGVGSPDSYRFDPRDMQGMEIDAEALADKRSLIDQTVTFALWKKSFVYHSPPFSSDTEVSGFFRLRAWIAIDCPDTDFHVSVFEISLDGGSVRLTTDAIRARYRESFRQERLVSSNEPLCYDFERFTFVSREVKRGHRLRLVISPMGGRLTEGTFAEKNYNGGGVVAEETLEGAKAVTVLLYHDADHSSALIVPLGRVHELAD
jgi:uncharacterized protein